MWSFPQRFAFRAIFIYTVLFFFPLPSGLASPDVVSGVFDGVWHRLVPWAGKTFLGLQVTNFTNGSGDTTYDYIRIGTMAAIALIGAVIWSILDRRRANYDALYGWAHLFLRYALAISMVTYGMSKVIKLQFPTPGFTRLSEPYGESSPMGLLWTFMGYSTAYTFFAGASEMLAALLLFFRRTAVAGALVTAAVMMNIALLNFCYDVPVKIGSVHLFVAAIVLLIPDLHRLFNAVILGRAVGPSNIPAPHFDSVTTRRLGFALKMVIVLAVLGTQFREAIELKHEIFQQRNPKPPEGWYEVSSMRSDGVEVPALATGGERWKMFALIAGYVRTTGFDRSTHLYKADGTPERGLTLTPTDAAGEATAGAKPVGQVQIQFAANGTAALQGTLDGHRVDAAMKRVTAKDFPLMKRGFHWISEAPYNR